MLVEGIRCFPLEERPFFRTVGNIPLFVDHSILPIVAIQFRIMRKNAPIRNGLRSEGYAGLCRGGEDGAGFSVRRATPVRLDPQPVGNIFSPEDRYLLPA